MSDITHPLLDDTLIMGDLGAAHKLTLHLVALGMAREKLPPLSASPLGYLRWHWLSDFEARPHALGCSRCGAPFSPRAMRWGVNGPRESCCRGVLLLLCDGCHPGVREWFEAAYPEEERP